MFDRIAKGLWWDHALTLIGGCTPVSPGCNNCWSAAMAHRFPKPMRSVELTKNGKWTGRTVCYPDRLALPLKIKKPTVFAVWNDLFHESVDFAFIREAFESFQRSEKHIFLILTKRPDRMMNFCSSYSITLKNVWLGTTAEDQDHADWRIPALLKTPAAKRFLSLEPLLKHIDLSDYLLKQQWGESNKIGLRPIASIPKGDIHWVICGCESGPRRRKTEWEWIELIQEQCQNAAVPFFLKQAELGGQVVKAPYKDFLQLPKVKS
jgi:protein gp37